MPALTPDLAIRRELRAGDAEGIVALHDRIYRAEYGVDERFAASVSAAIESAVERGWPTRGGAVWLVDHDGALRGALALTVESEDTGRVRWFVLAPELRGRGLGRALVAELIAEARRAGLRHLLLETFSALTAAAHIYRNAGFRMVSERPTKQWGPEIVYQCYELDLD